MPPRKKAARGTLKRSSSDGPELEDMGSEPKRQRADVPAVSTSHITLNNSPAHRARKPVTYTSKATKARQKSRVSGGSPKITHFFNAENKPKAGRALFHLSPSPRSKAKAKSKLFGSPKASLKRRGSKASASANNSRMDISVDQPELEEDEEITAPAPGRLLPVSTPPRPSSADNALDEHDEQDDQPAPLPFLSPVKPIEGPGLEIRTPLKGRIIPASIQSLSKRVARADGPSIPLFAATPRVFPSEIPEQLTDDSPTKSRTAPVFAPAPTPVMVPSTPAPKNNSVPSFAPSAQRVPTVTEEGSPTKRPAPVFGPTPARPPPSLRREEDSKAIHRPLFAPADSVTTPAHHAQTLPAAPPPLPTMSSAVPETTIPDTPTAQRRTPTFAPGLLFPPPDQANGGNQKAKVSRAPIFGVLDEGEEEGTPRTAKLDSVPEQNETKSKAEKNEDQEGANISMEDIFATAMVPSMDQLGLSEANLATPSAPANEPIASTSTDTLGPLVSLNGPVLTEEPASVSAASGPSVVTRSRSRSASASGSVPLQASTKAGSRAGSVSATSRTGSVSNSRANSVSAPARPGSRRGSNISLPPLVTDPVTLSRTNSLDQSNPNPLSHLQYRISQTAAAMMDTPGEEIPSAFPDAGGGNATDDDGNISTSPLSSLPEEMSFDMLGVGDKTAGDSTMKNGDETVREGDDTIQNEDTTMRDPDRSMSMRDPRQTIFSPSSSLPAPTSPVSSVHGDTAMDEDAVIDVVGLSSPPRPLPRPEVIPHSPGASTSSLTSIDTDTEEEAQEKAPAKSMIPVPKRPLTPGGDVGGPAKKQNGIAPGPNKAESTKNGIAPGPTKQAPSRSGTTPAPTRNGTIPASAKATARVPPTPIRAPTGPPARPSHAPTNAAESSTSGLGIGKPSTAKAGMGTRTRTSISRTARSLAAPTASTAAKTRAKVVTAPPPPRGRITSFMKPNAPTRVVSTTMAPPPIPASGSKTPHKGMSKDDSDIRGPRRSMISDDTQASLSSLSNALEKLARPSFGSASTSTRPGEIPPRPGTSMGFSSRPSSSMGFTRPTKPGPSASGSRPAQPAGGIKRTADPVAGKGLKSSTGAETTKVGGTTSVLGKGKGKAKDGDTSRNDDDAEYGDGKKLKAKDDPNAPLRSCAIFVDVRTAEGEDAGSLFCDMLRDLGAKIVSRPTPSTTHFVFKSGHQSTLTKHKLYDDPKPFLVGIGWVVECVEKREHVGEERFAIKTDEVSALDLRERRKSQLPHQMQDMARDPNPNGPKFGTVSAEAAAVAKSLEASMAEVEREAEAAAERSKKRAQQKLFPRV
ncbi:PTCB-BRCT domain protein [Ceratobasidium sp. AG-Ba]|nr:PTCB-BRCT domain protein [Ceratobasidium sp. AG-Ba]